MRFLSLLAVIFYTLVLWFLGGLIIWFTMHWIDLNYIQYLLEIVYTELNLRIIVGLSGLLLILISLTLFQLFLGKIQKEKTIAFTNPSGQVTVSLSAVEDFVRKLTAQIPEIKESRPDVIVNKKGIQIMLRLILREAITIPEITLKLQELIKDRVQDILGVEENILVKIHVIKIVSSDERSKKKSSAKKDQEEDNEEVQPTIPFQGYRSS